MKGLEGVNISSEKNQRGIYCFEIYVARRLLQWNYFYYWAEKEVGARM